MYKIDIVYIVLNSCFKVALKTVLRIRRKQIYSYERNENSSTYAKIMRNLMYIFMILLQSYYRTLQFSRNASKYFDNKIRLIIIFERKKCIFYIYIKQKVKLISIFFTLIFVIAQQLNFNYG